MTELCFMLTNKCLANRALYHTENVIWYAYKDGNDGLPVPFPVVINIRDQIPYTKIMVPISLE